MKRAILITVCVLLAPAMALAAGFTANLSGAAGSGIAVITIDGTSIEYNILVSGISNPSSALVSHGSTVVDLGATFVGGSAFGSTTSDDAPAIAANPGDWTVSVGDGSSVISGQLMGSAAEVEGMVLYHPVVAKVGGLAGTNFVTDVRMVNRSGDDAEVTIDYYQQGAAGHAAPTTTVSLTIADGQQVVADDFVGAVLGQTSSQGAVVVTSDRPITSSARIYNDQSDAGEGTFGQYSQGLVRSHGWSAGVLPFLSNEAATSGEGYRANIGWFNPNAAALSVTLRGYDADGTLLGEITRSIAGYAQQQQNVATLWPALADYGDFYVTYQVAGGENIFMYASVVDNVNGDAIFVPAIP